MKEDKKKVFIKNSGWQMDTLLQTDFTILGRGA
jgi:hypothetical protein